MTKNEFLKYNNPEAYDMQGKPIKPGDTVVINNHYGASPIIGIVSHFTQSGTLAVQCNRAVYLGGKSHTIQHWSYRPSRNTIKIKDGNKDNNKDQMPCKS